MTEKRYWQVKAIVEQLDDVPDGAFVALCAEHGVSVEDLVAYADETERRTSAGSDT